MATTPNGFPYQAATDPPDGAGLGYGLATFLDGILKWGSWNPGLGGGNGEALGTGGVVAGDWASIANATFLSTSLIYGSSCSNGTGQAILTGLPFAMTQQSIVGSGLYIRSGVAPIPIWLQATGTQTAAIWLVGSGGLVALKQSNLAAVQSDTLSLSITGARI